MQLCVIGGDGIGPEVMASATRVLQALFYPYREHLPPLEISYAEAGWATFQRLGTALPEATLHAARVADAVLFGAVASPSFAVPGYHSPIVALRKALDLYANIRPTTSLPLGQTQAVDLVVVRENTEGLYAGRERLEDNGATAIAERVATQRASERIAHAAFALAHQRAQRLGRAGCVTIVHKANVLRVSDGLFRSVALEVAARYPDIAVDELLVDTAAMQLAQAPQRFDVLVTTNLFGDILSDVACIHGGGLGLAASANLGAQHALFEPVHGAAPDLVGKNSANPLAALRSLAMLLDWQAQRAPNQAQSAIYADMAATGRAAIANVLQSGICTPDLGGHATSEQVIQAVSNAVQGQEVSTCPAIACTLYARSYPHESIIYHARRID